MLQRKMLSTNKEKKEVPWAGGAINVPSGNGLQASQYIYAFRGSFLFLLAVHRLAADKPA